MAITTTNPATGEVVKTFEALSSVEIDHALNRAVTGFATVSKTSFAERARWIRAAADILDDEADAVAAMTTLEMGKTLTAAKAEVTKCSRACRYYADNAEHFLADEVLSNPSAVSAGRAYSRYRPLGPVLAIMPWNYPLWQAMRFAAPALMAGNVGLLKHASNVPQTALFIGDLFARAGFPDGSFQTLLVGSDRIGSILADDRVVAATLTGSESAGRSVAEIAGRALKKTVLELGGSDPFVVMPSADLEEAARVAVTARCQNNGQSCIAAKRFVVHADVYDEFAGLFVAAMTSLVVGDPTADGTDVGPLATEQGRADVEEQVADAAAKGAQVLCGGERPDGPGWYYLPTVVAGITAEMRMWSEEVFGPVAGLFKVADYNEAIALANDTPFGLGSNAWTTDPAEKLRFAEDMDAGMVFINGMTTSYPELPFGGVKNSGYGRELSEHGIREFCNLVTVWIGSEASGGSGGTATHNE
jgi:succinate-semialdehyde dehydrogenase/glutarate-semialdehyde dehydrogenase